jgi:hypothetical protein
VSTAVRRALYGKMAGDTGVGGLTNPINSMLGTPAPGYGQSIYHDQAPEEASYPFIVFSKSSGVPTNVISGVRLDTALAGADPGTHGAKTNTWAAIETDVWLIKAVDQNTTADKAEAIAERLKTLLNDGVISISGYNQLFLRRESDVEYPETEEGIMYKHCGSLYRLIYTNP